MLKKTDKILCVCDGGNSRSVALAWVFKKLFDMDALSCGVRNNSRETLDILAKWADYIVICDKGLVSFFPESPKVKVFDVGPDVYFKHFEDRLVQKFVQYIFKEGIK